MYFRYQDHGTKQKNILKLENQILEKGSLLYECCVKVSSLKPTLRKSWSKRALDPPCNITFKQKDFPIELVNSEVNKWGIR